VKRTRKPKRRGRVRERGARLDEGGRACYGHCECGETRRCWTTRAFSVGGLVVRACGSKFTLPSPPKRKPAGPHFQRTGAGRVRDSGVSPGSSRSTRPPPGAHSTVWTLRRRGRAWPLSRRPGPDARSITAIGPSSGRIRIGLRVSQANPLCRLVHALDAEALGRASTNIGTIRVLPWVVIASHASLTRSSRPWSKSLSKYPMHM
jgi:hypothetical protein